MIFASRPLFSFPLTIPRYRFRRERSLKQLVGHLAKSRFGFSYLENRMPNLCLKGFCIGNKTS